MSELVVIGIAAAAQDADVALARCRFGAALVVDEVIASCRRASRRKQSQAG
jgi:hypothetical protein